MRGFRPFLFPPRRARGTAMLDLNAIEERLKAIPAVEAALADPAVLQDAARYRARLAEHASLKRLESACAAYRKILADVESARSLADDPELGAVAAEEAAALEAAIPAAERKVLAGLVPDDPEDASNAIFEIRAGTGGDEAALFAAVLFRMYFRYCEEKGWKTSVLSSSPTELGGYKEIVFSVSGDGAYGAFKFESGGHRVQRVPETEQQGRIHTSAATVVVFPESPQAGELTIPPDEIRIDIFCAGGHGGQGVNTTYSAIRMTHLPTGIVAQCQDERSQQRNKEKCLAVLKSRILDARRREEEAKTGADRLSLRGSGDRSERIRTYNFPQNRLTDHRIDLTLYSLDRVVEGALDPVLAPLHEHDLERRIAAAL